MKRSTAFLLALVIVLVLVTNSADFFFRTPFYETWDSAANALSVGRAKHFAQLYGPYSRWGFYHPGPALFYIQALGEFLFYDLLPWTPAPYNAQTLLYLFVSVGFFVAALRVFSRWLTAGRERWWFLCAALMVAVVHFTAVNHLHSYDPVLGPNVFFGLWSAHALVLPFLCLLAAGASVAAGEGDDLPLLALADGFLLQTHVAQPLFVLPLTALALAGLVWRCAREQRDRIRYTPSWRERLTLRLGAGWRAFRRAHVVAAVILAFFALPVLIDLCWGPQSNFAAILQHLRTHHTEHKSLAKAVCYFLQFGAYTPYEPNSIEFGKFDHDGMNAYLRAHWFILGVWAAVLLGGVWAMTGAVRPPEISREEAYTDWALRGFRPPRQRFAAWAAVFGLAALVLTLKWGTSQDGRMFYYNSWFNFAIYYFGVLIVLAAGCRWVLIWRGVAVAVPVTWRERLAGGIALALVCALLAGPLRVRDADPASTVAFHESVLHALADTATPGGGPPTPRMLQFPVDVWVTVAGVALQMERAHQPFYVPAAWEVTFGHEHAWRAAPPELIQGRGLQPWRFEYLPTAAPGKADADSLHIVTPTLDHQASGLEDHLFAKLGVPVMDPTLPGGAKLDFRTGNHTLEYGVAGWGDVEPDGSWTDGKQAVVEFKAAPVPAGTGDVEISLVRVVPFIDPPRRPAQRLRVFFNGEPLGEERALNQVYEALTFRVSAERWNRSAKGTLDFVLPDAVSPAALPATPPSDDNRVLGINVREIRFQVRDGSPSRP